jgi:hypothetical protein
MLKTQSPPKPRLPKPKPGRPTLLTPETQEQIVRRVREGYTLASAAREAGVNTYTLNRWLWRGRVRWGREFVLFVQQISAARTAAREARIKANPRPIRRARTERNEPDHVIRQLAYKEFHRVVTEGRVPDDVAREALQMVMDDIDDKLDLHEERRSWEDVDRESRRN